METNPTPPASKTTETIEHTSPVRIIPPTTREFQVDSGATYYVENTLTVERYKAFERLCLELAFSTNFSDLFRQIRTAFDLLNQSKLGESAIQLHQLMQGLVQIDEKRPIALYVATLFINSAEEDRSAWTLPLAEAKLKDWTGIDVDFFLRLALSKVSGFAEAYRDVSQQFMELIQPQESES